MNIFIKHIYDYQRYRCQKVGIKMTNFQPCNVDGTVLTQRSKDLVRVAIFSVKFTWDYLTDENYEK